MSPSTDFTSNIRAVVHWHKSAVYAGEDIECIITFTNIAVPPGAKEPQDQLAQQQSGVARNASISNINRPGSLRQARRASYAQSVAASAPARKVSNATNKGGPVRGQPQSPLAKKGHRPTLSLNVVTAPIRPAPTTAAGVTSPASSARPGNSHGRSLSIISLGGTGNEAPAELRSPVVTDPTRKLTGHMRSASLQHLPKMPYSQPGPGPAALQSPRQPSPLYEMSSPLPVRPARRKPGTVSAGNTPQMGRRPDLPKHGSLDAFAFPSGPGASSFRFPAAPAPSADPTGSPNVDMPRPARTPSNMHSSQPARHFSPRTVPNVSSDGWSAPPRDLNPLTRIMSASSIDGTPRSSSEMYTMSNPSDETLTSEAPSQRHGGNNGNRRMLKPGHSRQGSRHTSRSPSARAPGEHETLMMAYAQTVGHFTLDGGLVNTAPFEEVKRKGVQGGGGVVGVERSSRPTSLFGAFGWGGFGESLGGLLGGDEMSSLAQMKASAGSREIPLLSTPQSLLFVDLKLGPGESRSYRYRFALPHGLPPTYRGKAIKVTYHLSLGVQRPEGQAMRQVEVPFRVLGSYNARGDSLRHDLMQPFVLLQDAARTTSIAPSVSNPEEAWSPRETSNNSSTLGNATQTPQRGLEDFLRYTERLLERASAENNAALLSPSSPSLATLSPSRQGSLVDAGPTTAREAIDLAIIRANHTSTIASGAARRNPDAPSPNRFNIARDGQPIAVLTLLRASYRLGEAVTGTLDFTPSSATTGSSQPPAATYALLIELESAETVDPTLARRAAASVARVSRRVYAAARENTLFARRVAFHLPIPASAAPSFETSGVGLAWRLKVQFTTQRASAAAAAAAAAGLGIADREGGADGGSGSATAAPAADAEDFLEVLASDERGTVTIAKERLVADSFEIAVPLRVYGAVGIDTGLAEVEPLEL